MFGKKQKVFAKVEPTRTGKRWFVRYEDELRNVVASTPPRFTREKDARAHADKYEGAVLS